MPYTASSLQKGDWNPAGTVLDVETYAMFVTIYESRREERGDRSLVEVSLQLLDSMSTFLFNQTATTTL